MNKNLALALLFLGNATLLHAQTVSPPAYVTNAVADAARPDTDRQVDDDRKPAALITFAGIKPGDNVADVMPGGGYFTRIFSKVVGAKGHVYAIIPDSLAAKVPPEKLKPIHALVADPAYGGNTSLEIRPYDRLDVGASLDVVWTSQNYHDVYGAVSVFSVSGSTGPEQAANLDAAAFKALKPGGVFVVVDHAAAPAPAAGTPPRCIASIRRSSSLKRRRQVSNWRAPVTCSAILTTGTTNPCSLRKSKVTRTSSC